MLSRRKAKTNHGLADSSGFTLSKGIKAKLLKDPTRQDAPQIISSQFEKVNAT